jgi:predicted nucleic acid-binding protein
MRHVFLETNWLVAVAAPSHDRIPAAIDLLGSAATGEARIYIPACCIAEARKTIRQKFQPKEADRLRSYVRWAVEQNVVDEAEAEAGRTILKRFEESVTSDLAHLNDFLRRITTQRGSRSFGWTRMCWTCLWIYTLKKSNQVNSTALFWQQF